MGIGSIYAGFRASAAVDQGCPVYRFLQTLNFNLVISPGTWFPWNQSLWLD